MLVKQKKIPFYAGINKQFRSEVSALVEMILSAENIGRIKYQVSSEDNFENRRSKYFFNNKHLGVGKNKRELLEIIEDDKFNASNLEVNERLGKLELSLSNYIFARQPQNIVITGALGSGKSELINYVLDYISKYKVHKKCICFNSCELKTNIHILIDFNKYIRASDNHEKEFLSFMFYKIGGKIIELFNNEKAIQSFIEWSDKTYDETSKLKNDYFVSLIDDVIEKHENWNELSPKRKIKKIYSWILERFEKKGDFSNGLNAFFEMINFYHSKYPKISRTCFLFIYDNIDGLPDDIQNILIEQIMRISNETSIKTIITSRLTTFAHIKGNSSFSFGLFENVGKSPLIIIKKRLIHYKENRKSDAEYLRTRKLIDKEILNVFDKRLDYILDLLNQNESRLSNVITSLSGLSIRRSLRLVRRLFYSFVIPYNNTNPFQDLLIRSLFSYDFSEGLMRIDDNRISNIFLHPKTSKNSLICLRILNVLNDYRNENRFITKSDLVTHLSLFKIDNENLVRESTRYLRNERKRLIYLNGLGLNESDSYELENTEIHITTAGQYYIERLCSELGYIQSCFEIIDWNLKFTNDDIEDVFEFIDSKLSSELSPSAKVTKDILVSSIDDFKFNDDNNNISAYLPNEVDNQEITSRLQFLRKGLRVLLYQDIAETIIYIHNKARKQKLLTLKDINGINELVTSPLICKVCNSVFNILRSRGKIIIQDSNYEELQNWYNLLIITNEWNNIFFDNYSNKKACKLLNKIEEYNKK